MNESEHQLSCQPKGSVPSSEDPVQAPSAAQVLIEKWIDDERALRSRIEAMRRIGKDWTRLNFTADTMAVMRRDMQVALGLVSKI